jgi:DNA-binding NarL/FixJ family response regulator
LDPQQQQVIPVLCAAAGGVPLALETLAGWATSLTLDQVLQRREALLDEVMGPAADVSLESLPTAARTVLRTLAVFASPFSLEDAAVVSGVTDDLDLVRVLRTLVETGWLGIDTVAGSYLLAAPWRRVLLAGLEPLALRERHGRHVLASAVEAGRHLTGADQTAWRSRLEASAADVEQALRWAADNEADALGLEAAAGLWPWWLSGGRIAEGRAWIEGFLARTLSADESLLAKGWVAAAVLAAENGDHAVAVTHAAKASRAFGALRETAQQAIAEGVLGSANRYLGRRAEARAHFERALILREDLGDRRGVATSLNNLALLALDDGDLARARQMLERSLAAKRLLGEPRSVAIGLCNLAHTLLKLGLVLDALVALAEADRIAGELGDSQLTGTVAANLGDAHLAEGSYPEALQDFERSVASYTGHPHDQVVALCGKARALSGLSRREDALTMLRSAESLAEGTSSEHAMNEVRATLAQLRGEPLSPPPGSLTPRQAEILACLADGSSNREIAERLHLSRATVERHLATAYAKLGLRNRVEAARYALQHGLLPPTL